MALHMIIRNEKGVFNMGRNLILVVSLLLFLRAPSTLAVPIVDFADGNLAPIANSNVTYGYDFTVDSGGFSVTGLAVYEALSRPLEVSHEVGLWNSTGSLLASTTIDGLDSIVVSISATGQWRVGDIASLFLGAGNYYVGERWTPLIGR